MCLIAFAQHAHPRYALVLIANRDEFHARPTVPLTSWPECPGAAGGRDLQAGGTWLLTRTDGALAAVTNVRSGLGNPVAARSRGSLPVAVLAKPDPHTLWPEIRAERAAYGPFNLLVQHAGRLQVYHSPADQLFTLESGVHGLSNASLDTPWPKLRQVRNTLAQWCAEAQSTLAPLWQALANEQQPTDHELPDTGVGLELERVLGPAFIRGMRYGTRASSVVLVDHAGRVQVHERSFAAGGAEAGLVTWDFSALP